MFTVKGTYRQETRKFSFNSTCFPSYDELHAQLYRVFPISHNYYLSKLLFCPNASSQARILLRNEVHTAEQYNECIASYQGRSFPTGLLRFSIYDETPHKVRSQASEDTLQPCDSLSQVSAPTGASAQPRSLSPSHIPPPPIIFSSSPPPSQSTTAMDVDLSPSQEAPGPHIDWAAIPPPPIITRAPLPPIPLLRNTPSQQHLVGTYPGPTSFPFSSTQISPQMTQHCCSVAEGKASVQILFDDFKRDLDSIMGKTFGTEDIPSPSATNEWSKWRNFWWCHLCGKNFQGPSYYTCPRCRWRVACHECGGSSDLASKHRQAHGSGHTFVKHTWGETSPPVTTSLPTPPQMRSPPVVEPTPPAPAPPMPPTPSSPPQIHVGIICDSCTDTIVGTRHKCLECPDYDLCTTCMSNGGTERHNPFHEFFDINMPRRTIVHTVFSGNGQREAATVPRRVPIPPSPPRQISSQEGETVVAAHFATCNLCDSRIRGDRYKCLVCPDFDTCTSCFTITAEQHPNHGFVKINKPKDLMVRNSLSADVVHFATCDACKDRIRGIRYKCMHPNCPDYDLCPNCEALPIPVHPPTHPMLKMRNPDTMVPMVVHADNRSSAGETSQIKSTPSVPTPAPIVVEIPSPLLSSTIPASLQAVSAFGPSGVSRMPLDIESMYAPGSPIVLPEAPLILNEPISPLGLDSGVDESVVAATEQSTPSDNIREVVTQIQAQAQQLKHLLNTDNVISPADSPPQEDIELLLTSLRNAQDLVSLVPTATEIQQNITSEAATNTVVDSDAVIDSPLSGEALLASPLMPSSVERTIEAPVTTVEILFGPLLSTTASSTPSVSSVSIPEESIASQDVTAESPVVAEGNLNATFIADTTIIDGQIFPAGAEFMKCWRMLNGGAKAWPETTQLEFVAGERFGAEQSVKVGSVDVGVEVDVWTGELKAPEAPGRFVSYWKLNDGQGNHFGDNIWIDITVVEASVHSEGSSGDESLASSAVIMPSVPTPLSRREMSTETVSSTDRSSPVTAPSRPASEYAVSEVGSDESSISLISVPSSEDEVDIALWEDSRAHAPVSSDRQQPYIVLFDENSSEEE